MPLQGKWGALYIVFHFLNKSDLSQNYQQTIDWLFAQLPMYQRVGGVAYKKDLSNTILLANQLGNPQNNFKSIHVAGTNGKGSVSHMLASVLQEAGYKVGLYTSPHLRDFRERIKINGNMISEAYVVEFVEKHKTFFENYSLSFFEMTVGLAFDYFSYQKVDVAVIEVGMGGRLDSTNIIKPQLSVITNIGMDHTAFLGNTLPEIAAEKGGIIKPEVPVVIGETQAETTPVFKKLANEKKAELFFAEAFKFEAFETDLKGNYQKKNLQTAIAATKLLRDRNLYQINDTTIKSGLLNVVSNTGLQGRWQVLLEKPKVICDTAHNKEGLTYVLKQLSQEKINKLHIVLGFVADKDVDSVLKLFPKNAIYYFCKPDIPRGLDVEELSVKAKRAGLQGEPFQSVQEAYKASLKSASKEDLIFIGGSTFVVAEII
jgi:dihydrofolate synthase/folylpolyglutamate synthase